MGLKVDYYIKVSINNQKENKWYIVRKEKRGSILLKDNKDGYTFYDEAELKNRLIHREMKDISDLKLRCYFIIKKTKAWIYIGSVMGFYTWNFLCSNNGWNIS